MLRIVGETLFQDAQGGPDVGGYCYVRISYDEGMSWHDWKYEVWDAAQEFDITEELAGFQFKATEVGNGVNYVGESGFSNIVVKL